MGLLSCTGGSNPNETEASRPEINISRGDLAEGPALPSSTAATLNAMLEEHLRDREAELVAALDDSTVVEETPSLPGDEMGNPGGFTLPPPPEPSSANTTVVHTASCGPVYESQENNLNLNPAILERIFIRYCPLNLPQGYKISGLKAYTARMTGADGLANPSAWSDFSSKTEIHEAKWDDSQLLHTAYVSTDYFPPSLKWGPCQVVLTQADGMKESSCDSPVQGPQNQFLIEVRDVTPAQDNDEHRTALKSIRNRGRSLTEIILVYLEPVEAE